MTIFLMIVGLLAGCGDANGNSVEPASKTPVSPRAQAATPASRPPRKPAPSSPIAMWNATRCGDDEYRNARMERHPDLIGRTADDLLAAYGKPTADDLFRAGEGVGTYSGGVASQLPGGAAHNALTPVREIIWQKSACNFIVRFRRVGADWRVFDAFEASADADF